MKLNPVLKSKINWTNIVGLAAMILLLFGVELSEDQQMALVTVIGMASAALTWIWSQWFTPSAKGSWGLFAIDITQYGSVAAIAAAVLGWIGPAVPDERASFIAAPAMGAQILSIALRSLLPLLLRRA